MNHAAILPNRRIRGFTLIELLVVIAIIAILAAILFPVFSRAREKSRMTQCISNMKNVALAMMQYTQDYDETMPYMRMFQGTGAQVLQPSGGNEDYWYPNLFTWRNCILPYLKNIQVMRCPSNPMKSTNVPAATSGEGNAFLPPGQAMPFGLAMNSCVSAYHVSGGGSVSGGTKEPPVSISKVSRPGNTLMMAENNWGMADIHADWLWSRPQALYTHMGKNQCGTAAATQNVGGGGGMGNFIFFDGHVKTQKWVRTLRPNGSNIDDNQWVLDQRPGTNNLTGANTCTYAAVAVPACID